MKESTVDTLKHNINKKKRFIMNWFGKKKEAKQPATTASANRSTGASNPTTTILRIRESLDTQEKREAHLQKKIDTLTAEAKAKLAKKDKKGALFAMKRKKMYEAEIVKIENVKMTLETQVMNLEAATQNAETFKAMKSGTDAMKQVRHDVGIENVDDMMDDIKEEMDMANEISNAMASPVDPYAYDEDEMLAELQGEMMEDETAELEAQLTAPASSVNLPSVPAGKLPTLTTPDEDEDLRKLEAELSGM